MEHVVDAPMQVSVPQVYVPIGPLCSSKKKQIWSHSILFQYYHVVQMQPGQPSMSANRVYYQRSLVREIEARLKAKCDTLADLFAMDERYGLKVRMELLMAKALCGGICGRKVCDGGDKNFVVRKGL
ncbi:AUGMIN subunit 4 [Zea mays]|uniref:AUGMIN subunit 4 n=1 Tax=Zea mays TaxID=4577 RepID=A0A1D6MHK2_MAIZE|nr:AUGMIN subunit 4 [Zea mays]ONM28927.1 AUGMIN subunit 4 [Zea mays]